MSDEDISDLPDIHLESIYGYEAVRARISARLDRIERSAATMVARPPTHRKHLRGTPQALRFLRTVITELLAEGELWWSEEPTP